MRSFILLGFLAVAVSGAALPGYRYGPGVSGIRQEVDESILSGTFVGPNHNNGLNHNNAIVVHGSLHGGSSGSNLISGSFITPGQNFISSGSYKQSGSSGAALNIGIDALDSIPQTVHYSKQFYHFDAPEEAQVEGKITKQLSNILKKNLQVVFIKAPENNAATNAALQLAKQAVEQRTAIYVLSKEHDAAQLVGKLQQIQENVQTAPEVRFVKYRTPEDVNRAKASIQSQYDNFGEYADVFNGGVAPVLNYASKKPFQFVFGGSSSKPSDGKYVHSSKTEVIGAGNNFKSGQSSSASSSQSFESGINGLESVSTQLIGLDNLNSSSNGQNSSFNATSSYLPPTPFKK